MYKLTAMMAKIDTKSPKDTRLQRWVIGSLKSEVKGALWLPKDVKLPCEITIGFLNNSHLKVIKRVEEVEDVISNT